jgi:hypothetical protein
VTLLDAWDEPQPRVKLYLPRVEVLPPIGAAKEAPQC